MIRSFFASVCLLFALALVPHSSFAQADSCTAVAAGTNQNITAHGDCRNVAFAGFSGLPSVCAPTNTTPAEWQSFYNNPPAGVTITLCGGTCTGYSYGGYCYHWTNPGSAQYSCDTLCAGQGGCNLAGTRYIGSDDSSATRCSAVASALVGTSVTATAMDGSSGPWPAGCSNQTFKGGWMAGNYYLPTTTCASADAFGRICACNTGSGGGGSAPCNLPWGGTTAHNTNVTAYATPSGTCTSQTRNCNNGTLSGSYQYASCTPSGGNCDENYVTVGNCYSWSNETCGANYDTIGGGTMQFCPQEPFQTYSTYSCSARSGCGGGGCPSGNTGDACGWLPNGNNGQTELVSCRVGGSCGSNSQYYYCNGNNWEISSSCGNPPQWY